jgi:hypothetical protein
MLRAIAAAKKKNDQIDASKLADCLRCDFLPDCHIMPRAIRDRRRTLKDRHLLVQQMVQMKNRISGLLMETGVEYNKQRLHKVSYFWELLSVNGEAPPSIGRCLWPLQIQLEAGPPRWRGTRRFSFSAKNKGRPLGGHSGRSRSFAIARAIAWFSAIDREDRRFFAIEREVYAYEEPF